MKAALNRRLCLLAAGTVGVLAAGVGCQPAAVAPQQRPSAIHSSAASVWAGHAQGGATLAVANASDVPVTKLELPLPSAATLLSRLDTAAARIPWLSLQESGNIEAPYFDYGTPYNAAEYRHVGHRVFLRGVIGCPGDCSTRVAAKTTVAYVPCPPHERQAFLTGSGRVDIQADGSITQMTPSSHVSLDGVSYVVSDLTDCP